MGATGDAEQPRGPSGAERGGPDLGDAGAAGQLVLTNPWNIMIKHRQVQRRGRRSQMTTSFTDPAISMDLLRAVLQPSINEEIQTVFNKYMKFFQKAALNVRDNVGEEVDAEQLIQEACRSCLEQAKLLFSDGEKVIPRLTHEFPGIKVGLTVSGVLHGETDEAGRQVTSVGPGRCHMLPVCRTRSKQHPAGKASEAWPREGLEGVDPGSDLCNPRGPAAPRHWPFINSSLPCPSSEADRQKKNVPIEEAPFPKRGRDAPLDTCCQMTGRPPAWYEKTAAQRGSRTCPHG
ncbi:deoxynucleotidyltransferase terminal-interacting protein 1 isoform X5 [Crocuta crocuta]